MSRHDALYNTRSWRARREQQLRREPACKFCRDLDGRLVPASIADHITRHNGDPVLFRGPLQSLCKPCHDSRKAQIERSGHMRGVDRDGVPLDPQHPWRVELDRERKARGVGSADSGIGSYSVRPGSPR